MCDGHCHCKYCAIFTHAFVHQKFCLTYCRQTESSLTPKDISLTPPIHHYHSSPSTPGGRHFLINTLGITIEEECLGKYFKACTYGGYYSPQLSQARAVPAIHRFISWCAGDSVEHSVHCEC